MNIFSEQNSRGIKSFCWAIKTTEGEYATFVFSSPTGKAVQRSVFWLYNIAFWKPVWTKTRSSGVAFLACFIGMVLCYCVIVLFYCILLLWGWSDWVIVLLLSFFFFLKIRNRFWILFILLATYILICVGHFHSLFLLH